MVIFNKLLGLFFFAMGILGMFVSPGVMGQTTGAVLIGVGAVFLVGGCILHALHKIEQRLGAREP